eukprot:4864066-Amphidinium_carterae.8
MSTQRQGKGDDDDKKDALHHVRTSAAKIGGLKERKHKQTGHGCLQRWDQAAKDKCSSSFIDQPQQRLRCNNGNAKTADPGRALTEVQTKLAFTNLPSDIARS